MELSVRPEHLAVCRLPIDAPWPSPPADGSFFSVTGTGFELSVVCRVDAAPPDARIEAGWRALTVAGPLDFSAVGVIASLTARMAEAGVGVFVLSTYDTDHILVKDGDLGRAVDALDAAGYSVVPHPPA
ncbi:MAG TPA: ACT domain-containing protein [Acidimicrobiales bacterium]|nr:ACT domain-containing protein [Acidimicrobiales bacterium]